MPKRRAGPAALFVLTLAAVASAQGLPAPQAPPPAAAAAPRALGQATAPQAPALSLSTSWHTSLPAPPAGRPAIGRQCALVPLRDGRVAAVTLERGDLVWTAEASPEAVAAGGGLVFLASGDRLEARVAATGETAWAFDPGKPMAPFLAWEGGWLLAATLDGEALMLRASDGRLLWRRQLGARPVGDAAMTGDRLYLLLEDGRVAARRLPDGSSIWERRLPARPTAVRALDDRLFVGADDKYLYCLDADDGGRKWRWRTGGDIVGTPAVDADSVYFVSLDNVLRALDRGNGHQRWMQPLGFRPTGGPFLLGDLLLVPSVSPELALFRTAGGQPAGKVPADAEPVAPPRLLPASDEAQQQPSLVVVGREGSITRLEPGPPPLQAKPLPGAPAFTTLPPPVEGGGGGPLQPGAV